MTQKTNEELALEAGIPFNKYGLIGCDTCEQDVDDELDRFATLVEQRLLAKLLEGVGMEAVAISAMSGKLYSGDQVAAAVLAERERCAKVCEDEAWRLKEVAIKANSGATNGRAIAWADAADTIRGATT